MDSWEQYVDSLLTASYYFVIAAHKDLSSNGRWTSSAGGMLILIHEGYENVGAVHLYLSAKRLTRCSYQRSPSYATLKAAIDFFEKIENLYPDWAKEYRVTIDKQETRNAIAVGPTRQKESERIFGE